MSDMDGTGPERPHFAGAKAPEIYEREAKLFQVGSIVLEHSDIYLQGAIKLQIRDALVEADLLEAGADVADVSELLDEAQKAIEEQAVRKQQIARSLRE